ncbi:MAG: hypothetical protein QM808_09125 [Steroidobacteraceae bacterium]
MHKLKIIMLLKQPAYVNLLGIKGMGVGDGGRECGDGGCGLLCCGVKVRGLQLRVEQLQSPKH